MPALFEVVAPGFLTTVQDFGRPALGALGVAPGGACDPLALAMANRLVGNEVGAPALELTLVGPELRILVDAAVGLAGADLGGIVMETGQRLAPGRSHRLRAGSTISFPGIQPAASGARACLAVPGGIDVPHVLGAAATCLAAGFGGLDGRALRAGDIMAAVAPDLDRPELAWPAALPSADPALVWILATEGLQPGFATAFEALAQSSWIVGPASDRTGLRLEGPAVPFEAGPEGVSAGVPWGSVQVPPDGRPIVLLADGGPTGGYPVIAVAITADRSALGQLRAGSRLRFVRVTLQQARSALRAKRDFLERGPTPVGPADDWDDLWRSAGS